MTDFLNIEYLKSGNARQQQAYQKLSELGIFEKLSAYNPILTGTIPIGIDLPDSDLDIICQCRDHLEFSRTLTRLFSKENGFELKTKSWQGLPSTVAKFKTEGFEIEIFAQETPTHYQHAYRHMIIEHKILESMGPAFKANVLKLKREGLKTEPAFAKLLGLKGDPYAELLKYDMTSIDKPLLELNEATTDLKEISLALVKIIDYLAKNSEPDNTRDAVVLWISATNGYVSCHWYNSEDDEIDESSNYTVANFQKYFYSLDTENDEFFYDGILKAIDLIDKDKIGAYPFKLFQTDETNEPERIE